MRRSIFLLLPLSLGAETTPLFNGRDLAGWTPEGPRATFAAVKGEIHCSGAGNVPNWLRTDAEYENFRLEFDYRLAQWAEAAVYLRAPRAGRPARAGLAVSLAHDFHREPSSYLTGGIMGALEPRPPRPESWGAWHAARIELDGERLRVSIDGVLVQDVDMAGHAELKHRLKRGYIGFPDMGYAYQVRKVRLEKLPDRLKFLNLFDGRTLAGWELKNGGHWVVRDGAIHGSNGHGILYAPPVLRDFELTALVRSRDFVNSGIFLRGGPDGYRGFEVQIYSPLDSFYPTGSVYSIERSRISAEYEGRWFLMQIEVRGSNCRVRIDGKTVAETDRLPEAARRAGRVGLQIHKENAAVEFRDLRARELNGNKTL